MSNRKGLLQLNMWLGGGGTMHRTVFYLCVREYKSQPSKRGAAFIYHTFLQKTGTYALKNEGYTPSQSVWPNFKREFERYIFQPGTVPAGTSLLVWWSKMSSGGLAPNTVFDTIASEIAGGQMGLAKFIPFFKTAENVTTLEQLIVSVQQTALDWKLAQTGRTQAKEGETKAYFGTVTRMTALANFLSRGGFSRTGSELLSAVS